MKLLHPEDQFILQWNKTFLLCSVIALSLDPLFLYIPVVDETKKCLDVDRNLEITVCVLRSVADMLFVFHIIIQFRTAYYGSPSRREIIDVPHYVARRYLRGYFIIDVLAALPLPQFAVMVIIPNLDGPTSFWTKNILKFIIFFQYIPRVIRISLFYKKVTKISGFLTERAWAGAAFNFFLYVLASHVVGAIWYLFAIESELRCWNTACERHNCYSKFLDCGEGRVGNYGFLNTSCPLLQRNELKDSTDFDFGIYLDALQTRVLETRDFCQKILFCSWWGLQSVSSLGQGLKTSTFYGEILFADFIAVIGLVLFALLIGNMQKYLQSFSNLTLRVEEKKQKRREAEDLMSHISLPEDLRRRVRRHQQYKWKLTRGVELDPFVKDLPRDLRRDIKRHLCFSLLRRVPMFAIMDEHLLEAMCDRLKKVLYTENSYLFQEGDLLPEMLFITRGKLLSMTTNGGRTGFFNAAHIMAGDFCGEEILSWALDPKRQMLPFSTRTVVAVTDVEAFSLVADDLMFVTSQFKLHNSRLLQHTFRYHSQQWRTWAACFIQAAWRKHCKRKLEKVCAAGYIQSAWRKHCKRKLEKVLEENRILQEPLVTSSKTSTLSIGVSIYASRFSVNALNMLRQKHMYNGQVQHLSLSELTAQPDLDDDRQSLP